MRPRCGAWISYLPDIPSPYADDTTVCVRPKGHSGDHLPDRSRYERVTRPVVARTAQWTWRRKKAS